MGAGPSRRAGHGEAHVRPPQRRLGLGVVLDAQRVTLDQRPEGGGRTIIEVGVIDPIEVEVEIRTKMRPEIRAAFDATWNESEEAAMRYLRDR